MVEERTPALVLRGRTHGESDKIVTFLTRDWGKVTGIAKGAKRSQRRFVNVLEPSHAGCPHPRHPILKLIEIS